MADIKTSAQIRFIELDVLLEQVVGVAAKPPRAVKLGVGPRLLQKPLVLEPLDVGQLAQRGEAKNF